MSRPEPYSACWTLADHVDRAAALWPEHDALVFGGVRRTFERFADATFEFARALLALGVGKDDTVGVLLPAGIPALTALYGAARVGAIGVRLDPGQRSAQLRDVARPDAAEAARLLAEERCTVAVVDTAWAAIVEHAEDLSDLWLVAGDPELLRATAERTPAATQVMAYGSAEVGGLIAISHLDDPPELRLGSPGRPFHGIEVRILDLETGAVLPAGRRGRIAIKGWSLFQGYHNDSAPQLDPDGFLHLPDVGSVDASGRLFLGDVAFVG